jgi:Mg2+ and Co2+ transporter CorA
LDKKSIYEVVKDYEFHELDIEACLEENQRARVDKYGDYLFIIFNFPKYNSKT